MRPLPLLEGKNKTLREKRRLIRGERETVWERNSQNRISNMTMKKTQTEPKRKVGRPKKVKTVTQKDTKKQSCGCNCGGCDSAPSGVIELARQFVDQLIAKVKGSL